MFKKWIRIVIFIITIVSVNVLLSVQVIQAQTEILAESSSSSEGCAVLREATYQVVEIGDSFYVTSNGIPRLELQAGDVVEYRLTATLANDGSAGSRIGLEGTNGSLVEESLRINASAENNIYVFEGQLTVPLGDDYTLLLGFLASNVLSDEDGELMYTVRIRCFGDAFVTEPADNRVNWQYGDLFAVAYSDNLDGEDRLLLYCSPSASTYLGFVVTESDIANLTPTDQHQLIASVFEGDCHAEFYLLTSNEYQLNIYDPEGKIYTLVASDLDFTNAVTSYFDPNE